MAAKKESKKLMSKKPTIIYVMSDKRSGSTLLENILSKSNECFSVGELALLEGHLKKEGPGEKWNWNCACGSPFTECVFWSSIVKESYGQNQTDFAINIAWNFKSKGLIRNAFASSSLAKKLLAVIDKPANKKVTATLEKLYSLIHLQSGKSFIVDSSKTPFQALAIYKKITGFDVKIIWLKRDLRAIVTSKMKWKSVNKKKEKSMLKLLMDVFYLKKLCYTVFKMAKPADVLELHYEDLAKNPQQELDKIFNKFGLEPYKAPEFMELSEDHTIAGTPGRFKKRPIQYDESWKQQYQNNKLAYWVGGVLNGL